MGTQNTRTCVLAWDRLFWVGLLVCVINHKKIDSANISKQFRYLCRINALCLETVKAPKA